MKKRAKMTLTLSILGLVLSARGWAQVEPTLTLQGAIERGMSRSPLVRGAEALLQSQREKKRIAWSYLGPRATLRYNEAYFEAAQLATFGPQTITLRDDVAKTGSLTVAQPITGLYGVIEYGRLSGLQVDRSEEVLKSAKREAGFGSAEDYTNAYLAQEIERIAQQSILAAKNNYQDALAFQRVGRLAQIDVLKLQLALSQAETRASEARAVREKTFSKLQVTLELPPEQPITLGGELPIPQSLDLELPKALEAARQHPDVRKASLDTEIAEYAKKVAYAKLVPNVNVFAKIDRNFGDTLGFGGEKATRSYGISVEWDIWSNGSSVFEIRDAIAQKAAADAGLVGVQNRAVLEAVGAWEDYRTAQEQVQQLKLQVAAADEAYRIDQTRFRSGQVSSTELIRSETQKTEASGRLIEAQVRALQSYFRLQKTMGQDTPKI